MKKSNKFKQLAVFFSFVSILTFQTLAKDEIGTGTEVDKFNTYQWNKNTKEPWFEWWYYKILLPETKDSFFFVYGVVNPWDQALSLNGTRSYVSMGDFSTKTLTEKKFNINQFYSTPHETYVEIAGLIATDKYIKGELMGADGTLNTWDVTIEKDWSFNAMGWTIDKNITNIMWYPAQASARCSGTITSHGKVHQFSNAPCYQDRNWGTSFPLWWTWIVSNHFKGFPESALAIGGGRPKYFNSDFPYEGVAIGFKHKGTVYHFRPNDFDNVKVDVNFGKWEVSGNNGNYKIEVSANAKKENFMDLQFMTPTGEIFHDYEALNGEVTVKLFKRVFSSWKLVDELYSDAAGIEYGSPNAEKVFINSQFNLQ